MKVVITKARPLLRMTSITAIAIMLAAMLPAGCVGNKTKSESQNPSNETSAYAESIEAAKYLYKLAAEGRLPWIADGESGKLDSDSFPLSEVVYPVVRTFTFKKVGDGSVCHYQAVKQSRQGEWRLESAWWLDSAGKTISTWPDKSAQ